MGIIAHCWPQGHFSPSIATWWPTYILPKSIISRSRGFFTRTWLWEFKNSPLSTFYPCLMMPQGGFPSSILSSIKVLKSSLKRTLLCNHDFQEEPPLCPNSISIWLAENHLPFLSVSLQQPVLSVRMLQRRVCVVRGSRPTAALPGAKATGRQVTDTIMKHRKWSESLMGRISLTSTQSKKWKKEKTACNEEHYVRKAGSKTPRRGSYLFLISCDALWCPV